MKTREGTKRVIRPVNTWWLWEDRNERDQENATMTTIEELGRDLDISEMELTLHYGIK